MNRLYNFSAGPAVLPVEVLEEARENLLSLGKSGIGIMEHSHRGAAYSAVHEKAEADCRRLAGISDDYDVLFLQGGASSQFFAIPMNFLEPERTADYLVTGSWSKKAVSEAKRFGKVRIACSSEETNFDRIPGECQYSDGPTYVHFTSNNTIFGTQFEKPPEVPENSFLAVDASSDILSRPLDVGRYGVIYAGAQKNLGPSGVTLVIVRKDLVERGAKEIPTMLQYRTHAEKHSLYNTPPTFGIYVMGLVFEWITKQGGLEAIADQNGKKAKTLYDFLDRSSMFRPTAQAGSRSRMNVTFVTGDAELDKRAIAAATEAGFDGLKGHRSVGGLRASIYNAFPPEGVDALVEFLTEFERRQG